MNNKKASAKFNGNAASGYDQDQGLMENVAQKFLPQRRRGMDPGGGLKRVDFMEDTGLKFFHVEDSVQGRDISRCARNA